jgi:hypothetical protein
MFDSLKQDQSVMEVLNSVMHYQQFSFEVEDNDTIYHYVQGQHPVTGVLFGVYFEDDKLVSLILDQQVTDLARCRSVINTEGINWLSEGMGPFANWIKDRNQLDTNYDRRANHLVISEPDPMTPAEAAEILTYLPIIAIFLPLYGIDQIAGGFQNNSKMTKEKRYYLETVGKIKLGTSEDMLLQLMGSPDRQALSGRAKVWTYNQAAVSFGLVDGIIKWKESSSSGTARNSSTLNNSLDCYSLKSTYESP